MLFIAYVVGGQSTLINSLDVHVSGVAGGSMVRASKSKIVHVGPRSAHIANLPYSAFTDPLKIVNHKVVRIQPLDGDPDDYIAIESEDGFRCTITVTCAATALGLVKLGDFSYGNVESCKKTIGALAKKLGMSVEECATAILDDAANTCIVVIEKLVEKHKVERDQITLIGGGATSLLPFTAKKMNLPYQIAENAEVISSIGVALAMVRDVVERVIPNPTPQDLAKKVTLAEATEIAAASMRVEPSKARCIVKNDNFFIFGSEKGKKQEVRVVDKKGFVKIQRGDGDAVESTTAGVRSVVDRMWEELSVYKSDIKISPDFYLCIGAKVIDYEGMSGIEQLHMVMDSELMSRLSNDSVLLIAAKNDM